jgi:hypothetical protein
MWRIAGSVVLVLGGLFWMYFSSSIVADKPLATHALILRAAAPGLIAVVVGVGQCLNLRWAWSDRMWLIAGSVVLILGGGFFIFFWAAMGVMLFDNPSTTGGTYLNAVIPIAALGLIAVVVGIGQLIWK